MQNLSLPEIIDCDTYLEVNMVGHTGFEELLGTIRKMLSHPMYGDTNDLWVFGREVMALQFEQLNQITDYILHLYPATASRSKTAIVVPTGMNESFAEIWKLSSDRLPYQVKIFADHQAAVAWVNAE